MIYNFKSTVKDKKDKKVKQFYITADDDTSFYKRCFDQYRLDKSSIEIIERLDDSGKLISNKQINKKTKDNKYNDNLKIANEMLTGKVTGLSQDDVKARIEKGLSYSEVTSSEKLADLLSKYKKVKLYYLKTGAKKHKKYIALYK